MRRLLSLSVVALCAAPIAVPAAEPVTPEQAAKLFALIKPQSGEEKWQQIPWTIDLWAARQRAAKEGKPILLWEMDGHPLACT